MSMENNAEVLAVAPHSLAAEQAVIAAILCNNTVFDDVCDILDECYFYSPINALLYETARKLIISGSQANPVSLKERLDGTDAIESVGGWDKVWPVIQRSLIGIMGNRTYAETVKNLWVRRQILIHARLAQERAAKPDGESAQEILDTLEGSLLDISLSRSDMSAKPLSEAMDDAIAAAYAMRDNNGLSGVPTGYDEFDRLTGGLEPGTITIMAGRPAMGKTGAGLGIAIRSANITGKRTLYWTGEVSAKQLSQRALAAKTNIPLECIRSGKNRGPLLPDGTYGPSTPMRQDQWDKLVKVQRSTLDLPVEIEDTPAITVPKLYSAARRMARSKQGLGLIVVDYLALMKGSKQAQRQGKYAEVSEISADLLALAKNLNVPVLALQQLNRDVEKRENKRPLGSDLRDSGNLEQDASIIVLLYRQEYYLQKEGVPVRKDTETAEKFSLRQTQYAEDLANATGKALWIVDKNRQGPTGDIQMQFNGPQTWFRGRHEDEDSPAW